MSLKCSAAFAVIFFGFLQFLGLAPALAKVKRHDTIVMKNGDRLSGEVKRLEQGILYLATDYFAGNVGVDWLQVAKVDSTANFQITLNDGQRLTGKISKKEVQAAEELDFKVSTSSGEVPLSGSNVIQIDSQKPNFWRQLQGSIDLGYNYTSGNSQSSLSTSANAEYIAPRWAAGASYNASYSGQSGGTSTNLFQVQSFGERFLNRNSYLLGLSDFLHSSQQDLILRTTLGGAYGRYFFRNNQSEFRWFAGGDFTRASYQSGLAQPIQQNGELLLGAEYRIFHFDRYSLQSQLLLFPGLSDLGRIRMTANGTFNVKLPNNFHFDFSLWDNFDSRPPLDAKKNALGLSTGLGWTF